MISRSRLASHGGLSLARMAVEATGSGAARVATIVAICLLLVSCGGEPRLVSPERSGAQELPAGSPVASPLAPNGAAAEPSIAQIVWATAVDPRTSAPVDSVERYESDAPRLIAAARVAALPAGATLQASWAYNDTSLDAFTTGLVVTDPGAERWISFFIERSAETPWPAGVYEVTISLAGTELQRAAIEVVAPDR